MLNTRIVIAASLFAVVTAASAHAAAIPGGPKLEFGSESQCGFNAAMQPLVQPVEINGIGGEQQIWLTPVCEDTLERNSYGTLFRDGNVETLRNAIRRNGALMSALNARGYDQFDVVALRFGTDTSVNLFVHQRDMR
jgi:hypothetical protein